jgi:abortive infection bacteriophage resistance protein
MHYEKPPLTHPLTHNDLIIQLQDRGLIVSDYHRVLNYLKNVGYYRLSGYMFHLQSKNGDHLFKEGTHFNDIIEHYQFDNKLRHLILSYMDRIEVSFRAHLIDEYSLKHGFFWYTNQNLYEDWNIHEKIVNEITERFHEPQERFLRAYKSKYFSETHPPSNMAMEVLSFGKLSKIYAGLKNDETKLKIAKNLTLPNPIILTSWLIHLTHVRNACAHHARIWNRGFTAERPKIPSRKDYKFYGELPINFNQSLYGVISIMARLLSIVNQKNNFIPKFSSLLDQHPKIEQSRMGFPNDWKENPAWKNWV